MGCLSDLVWEMDAPGNGLLCSLNLEPGSAMIFPRHDIYYFTYSSFCHGVIYINNFKKRKKETCQIRAWLRHFRLLHLLPHLLTSWQHTFDSPQTLSWARPSQPDQTYPNPVPLQAQAHHVVFPSTSLGASSEPARFRQWRHRRRNLCASSECRSVKEKCKGN